MERENEKITWFQQLLTQNQKCLSRRLLLEMMIQELPALQILNESLENEESPRVVEDDDYHHHTSRTNIYSFKDRSRTVGFNNKKE